MNPTFIKTWQTQANSSIIVALHFMTGMAENRDFCAQKIKKRSVKMPLLRLAAMPPYLVKEGIVTRERTS